MEVGETMTDWKRIRELAKQAATKTYLPSKDPEVCRRRYDKQNTKAKEKRKETRETICNNQS
jgi:hypothetical protein